MSANVTPYDLNFRHLNAVRAIGRHGGIGRAAAAVFLSQPAITQAVAKLERRLATRLFDRHPAGMTPTPAGRILLARADRAAAHLATAAGGLGSAAPVERLLTLVQLRALIAVVRHGSFAVAARASGVSQPSIHRAARDLERLAQVPLLVRRGRTIAATPAAAKFVEHARLAVAELAAALDEIAEMRGLGAGRIAIGAMPLARSWLLPKAVTQLNREAPKVRFEIVEGPYSELLAGVRAGALDVLIGALRDPAPADDVVEAALFDDCAVVVAGAHHPLAGTAPGVADLRGFPWIVAREGSPLRAHWAAIFTSEGTPPPAAVVECGSVVAIMAMLREGDWLTLLSPDQVRRGCTEGRLVILGPPLAHARRAIGTTVRRDWLPSVAQSRFMTLLARLSETSPD